MTEAIKTTMMSAWDAADAPKRPLAAIQDIIDQAVQLIKDLGSAYRPQVEAWADTAAATMAATIPNPALKMAVMFIAPRLIDMALDAAFGPDADNT